MHDLAAQFGWVKRSVLEILDPIKVRHKGLSSESVHVAIAGTAQKSSSKSVSTEPRVSQGGTFFRYRGVTALARLNSVFQAR